MNDDARRGIEGVSAPVRNRVDLLIGLALFGVHLGLYTWTLTPGLPWAVDPVNPPGDSHEFTMAIAELRLARRTGYPIYTWLGFLFTRIFPFGEVAYRTNLLSAIFAATAIPVMFAIARRLALRPPFAALTALSFGMGTTFWSQAVITEVYTLNTLALSLVIWSLLRWSDIRSTATFAAFALAYGVSIGTHMSNLSLGAAFALFILCTDFGILSRYRMLALAAVAFLIGLAQYVWVPLMAETATFPNPRPDNMSDLYKYTIGAFSNLRFAFPIEKLPRRFFVYLSFLHENFGTVGITVGAIGMWEFLRQRTPRTVLFVGIFAINVFIAMQVYATDVEVFFLPSYVAWAVFVGVGASYIWNALPRLVERATRGGDRFPRIAAQTCFLLVLASWTALTAQASFLTNDRRTDTAFEDFYESIFEILPRDSHLAPGPGVFGQGALYFQKVKGVRPDVTIHTMPGRMKMPPTPVYSTLRVLNGLARAPFVAPPFPPKAWLIPELVGNGPEQILYRVDRTPPSLIGRRLPAGPDGANPEAAPKLARSVVKVVGGRDRPRLKIQLQWNISDLQSRVVLTRVDGTTINSRTLGMGNLERFLAEGGRLGGGPVVEAYEQVLPRSLKPGTHTVQFGLSDATEGDLRTTWFEPATVATE